MALQRTTRLEAVNTMLSILGEAPINSLEGQLTPDAETAKRILDETNIEVQSRGWQFNREEKVTLTPDANTKKIGVPINALRVDVEPDNVVNNIDVTQRGTFLYDKFNHTFEFNASIKATVVWGLEWNDLPEPARRYIMIRAGRAFQSRVVGSEKLTGFTLFDEQRALVDLEEFEGDTADHTIFDHRSIASIVDRPDVLGRIR